jgi:phosphoenolpyruvate phosphomutase
MLFESRNWPKFSNISGISSADRGKSLRELLSQKACLRAIEAHSPLSALLVEKIEVENHLGPVGFDAFWSSSLTDSTLRGKPDIEILDLQSRLININEIFEVTTKPMIVDGDTGGLPEHFELNVRSLERQGVSAVVIEDKTGLKKNSLLGNEVLQQQETIENFCDKIRRGKRAQVSQDFMIFARIESLILEAGMSDALERASAYVAAGADGILIHSRKKSPDEVIEFAARFKEKYREVPLVCVPTSYSDVRFADLAAYGFNIVIYANHLLRASYPAMRAVALDILTNDRSLEAEEKCLSINDILDLIPGTK